MLVYLDKKFNFSSDSEIDFFVKGFAINNEAPFCKAFCRSLSYALMIMTFELTFEVCNVLIRSYPDPSAKFKSTNKRS